MPRYHFNIFDGVEAIDREGMSLAGATEAKRTGLRHASDMLREEADKATLGAEWRIEVTDGRGMILFRIDAMVTDAPAVGYGPDT